MAMIYIDPTEAREGSRLPEGVIQVSRELPGLERRTGADMMVTPISDPLLEDVSRDILPVEVALRRHIETGAILIQRKSGGDFLQSIPDLGGIEDRMLEWARPGGCWLLVTELRGKGKMVVGPSGKHGKPAASVLGAFDWWKLRGGNVEVLDTDGEIHGWVSRMCARVDRVGEVPVRQVRAGDPIQGLSKESADWVTTGSAFPGGIGRAKREALHTFLVATGKQPSLANAMFALTSGQMTRAGGWGGVLEQRTAEWWGIRPGRVIRDTGNFGRFVVTFDRDLAFEIAGEGIECTHEDTVLTRKTIFVIDNYNAAEALGFMLAADPTEQGG